MYQAITSPVQSPWELTIQLTHQAISLRQKLLLASKSPAADIPYDDVLAHIIWLVIVVEDLIPFMILKKWVNDKK